MQIIINIPQCVSSNSATASTDICIRAAVSSQFALHYGNTQQHSTADKNKKSKRNKMSVDV